MGEEKHIKKLKDPKTFKEQLEILKSRNMIIENEDECLKILSRTNYYRLTAYALQCKVNDDYNNKISFNEMYQIYMFDKKLRNLIMEILEGIEVSLRTYMAYSLAMKYGPEAHEKEEVFDDLNSYKGYFNAQRKYVKGLKDEISSSIYSRRRELFIKHYKNEYDGHFPIWVIVEVLSFGVLSRMYSNLKTDDKKIIARGGFNTSESLLSGWVDNLSTMRNTCAHYGRLYNKKFTPISIHYRYKKFNLINNGLFVYILAIKELTLNKQEWIAFRTGLESLVDEYEEYIDLKLIDFPDNWKEIIDVN